MNFIPFHIIDICMSYILYSCTQLYVYIISMLNYIYIAVSYFIVVHSVEQHVPREANAGRDASHAGVGQVL